jgi:hypothetical protein
MSSKQELIEKIVHLLLTEFEPYRVTAGDRAFLERSTVSYLEAKLQQLQSEVAAKQARALAQQDPEFQRAQAELAAQHEELEFESTWTTIIRTPIGDRVVKPIEGNKAIIRGWLNPGETPSFAWFQRILEENPILVTNQLQWDSADKFDPAKRQQATAAQLAGEQRLFADFCRRNRVSENEANFGIWRETHSTAGLAPASQAELDQWNQERIELRNNFLLNADNQTLRNIARREGVERHQAALQAEADRQLEASQARDAAIGFPPLPTVWKGEPLDAGFIKRAASETLRLLNRRFGAAAVNARLCGK